MLRNSDLNQMYWETCSVVLIWIMICEPYHRDFGAWVMNHSSRNIISEPKSWSESSDSRYAKFRSTSNDSRYVLRSESNDSRTRSEVTSCVPIGRAHPCPNPFKGFTLRSESFEGIRAWMRPFQWNAGCDIKPAKHWSQTQFLEGHSSTQFSSNPNQMHLIQIIMVFRITRNFQASVCCSWLELISAKLWPSGNWVWDHCCKGSMGPRSVHQLYPSKSFIPKGPLKWPVFNTWVWNDPSVWRVISPLCRTSTSNAAKTELLKSSRTQITPVTIFSVYCHLASASGAWWQKLRDWGGASSLRPSGS